MVWKQDLAKLKQALPDSGGPPLVPPKPKPKPSEIKDLGEEDAFFLAAMGAPVAPARKSSPPLPPSASAVAPVQPLPGTAPVASPEPDFEAGLSDLKGLRPLSRNPLLDPLAAGPSAPAPTPPASAPPTLEPPIAAAISQETRLAAGSAPAPLPERLPPFPVPAGRLPLRIQLAAGMAVEVDATLDLRSHSVSDALGRLRDRVEDGALMGWRTLHVVLGDDAALHAAVLELLAGGNAPRISRYAQAPIPMGGAQAWVLYY